MRPRKENKVINIGDLELWQKEQADPAPWRDDGECQHRKLTADEEGEILTCSDCKKQVSAYWAFMRFSAEYRRYAESLKARADQVRIREEKGLILKAAQAVEKAWRSKTMVPACPHCQKAIMPNDRFGGLQFNKRDPEGAEKSFKKVAPLFFGGKS